MADDFYSVVQEAVADISENGFDSVERINRWIDRLRLTAETSMVTPEKMRQMLDDGLKAIYRKMVDRGGLYERHPTVGRFTIEQVKPKLRAELDRRVLASAQLIRLNRAQAIEKTIQRFSGWATSVPKGGSDQVDRREVTKNVRKSLSQLPFEERRVLIDQGHKFTSSLSEILATDGGAIAATWHSRWRQAGYNYREDHKERDQLTYAVRGNWAIERGLMKPGPNGYTDDITKPAEEPFCRCTYRYVYALRDLPADMLTAKGRAELQRVRVVA